MAYLFGILKVPKSFSVKQLASAIKLIENDYMVKIEIAEIKELDSTFYKLKLKSDYRPQKINTLQGLRAILTVDNDLNLYKSNPQWYPKF